MRPTVMLSSFLCLSAGAAVVVPAYLGQRVDAVLTIDLSSAALHEPLSVAGSIGRPASEPQAETDVRKSSEAETSHSGEAASDRQRNEKQGGASDSGNAKSASAEPASANAPKIAVARISGSGSASVFAGTAEPGSSVTVLENGQPFASTTANANGDWSLVTEHQFAAGDPKISLRSGAWSPPVPSSSVASTQVPGSAPPAAVAGNSQSPSAEVLKKFESMVASARQEAQARSPSESQLPAQSVAPAEAAAAPRASADVSAATRPAETLRDQSHPASATIPVPMTFIFDEATLTADGEKTARLLLEYLQLKKYSAITLSGHADERGTADYNMELSRKRLETVSEFLRNGGYAGKMDLVPKGATEPFNTIDRSKFSRDDLMQLDRRVELRNAS